MLTIASQERRLELMHAVSGLCDAILGDDSTSDVLQTLVDIAGPALRADRAHIYDVRLSERRAVRIAEWLRPDRDDPPTRPVYSLAPFGAAPAEFARGWSTWESSRDNVHPLFTKELADLLHGELDIQRFLCHPLRRHEDGYFLLCVNQVADRQAWTVEDRSFVYVAAAHVDLALMKLDLLREREGIVAERRTNERRFRLFYDATPSMFFTVDEDGVVHNMNSYASQHLGYLPEEVLGQSVLLVVHPEDRPGVMRHLAACFENPGSVTGLTFRKICKDGSTMWVREAMRVVEGPDGKIAFIACDDITQSRAHEEAARQAETKAHDRDEFMAMLGHELRNPLTPIVSALDILRRRGRDDAELEVIDRQVSHLRRLVDDLLDVSRITRGKVELNLEHVELSVAVTQAVEVVRSQFQRKRQPLFVTVPSRGLAVVADPTRLVQVFVNLLTNSAKFSSERQPVFVSAERRGNRIVAEVRDNGDGIDPEMLDRVFDLFVQRGQPADRAQSGLGLGLTIVRNLIALHGGTVRASSEGRGKGTVIVVELPLAQDPAVLTPPSTRMATTTMRADTARSILVVDDNDDVRTSLCRLLDLCGFYTVGAGDGYSALRAAEALQPKVILIDIGLPGMDGYQLARELRRAFPTGPQLVAISGYGQPSDRDRSREAGFIAHVVKPVDIDKLLPLLEPLT